MTTSAASRSSRIVRSVLSALLVLVLAGAVGTQPAGAINPPQTTVRGTAEVLYPWVNYFSYHVVNSSGRSYVSPKVYLPTATTTDYGGGCVFHSYQVGGHCSGGRHEIYLHVGENQAQLNRWGDYAVGSTMAHEFGHHAAELIGLRFRSNAGSELYADCMAGAFSRYVYANRVIDMNDVYEAYNRYDSFSEGGANGYPMIATRKAYWAWGFNNYNPSGCATYATQA